MKRGTSRLQTLGLLALGLLAGACQVSKPSAQEALDVVGFRTPRQAFETFRLASRGNLVDLEYRTLSSGFTARNRLSRIGYGEFRDEWLQREPLLRWALSKFEVTDEEAFDDRRTRLTAHALGRTLVIDLIREDFFELWSGERLVDDDLIQDLRRSENVRAADFEGKDYWVVTLPLGDTVDADGITETRVGSEWKIDDLRTLENEP